MALTEDHPLIATSGRTASAAPSGTAGKADDRLCVSGISDHCARPRRASVEKFDKGWAVGRLRGLCLFGRGLMT